MQRFVILLHSLTHSSSPLAEQEKQRRMNVAHQAAFRLAGGKRLLVLSSAMGGWRDGVRRRKQAAAMTRRVVMRLAHRQLYAAWRSLMVGSMVLHAEKVSGKMEAEAAVLIKESLLTRRFLQVWRRRCEAQAMRAWHGMVMERKRVRQLQRAVVVRLGARQLSAGFMGWRGRTRYLGRVEESLGKMLSMVAKYRRQQGLRGAVGTWKRAMERKREEERERIEQETRKRGLAKVLRLMLRDHVGYTLSQ